MNTAECYRCGVGFDNQDQIACVASAGEDEPEFLWCCVECLVPGDEVCDKNECRID